VSACMQGLVSACMQGQAIRGTRRTESSASAHRASRK